MNKNISYLIKISSITFFILFLLIVYLNSTNWFRMVYADIYIGHSDYARAISIYKKILRKSSVGTSSERSGLSFIYYKLGNLYSKLNETNMAILNYSKTDQMSSGENISFAMGALESGKWKDALRVFTELKSNSKSTGFYEKYMVAAEGLMKTRESSGSDSFYFAIGDAYIENKLFDEAKEFFTRRILLYEIDPINVLAYVYKRYDNDTDIKRRVWGNSFYVTLEQSKGDPLNTLSSYIISNLIITPMQFSYGIRAFIVEPEKKEGIFQVNIVYPNHKSAAGGPIVAESQSKAVGEYSIYRVNELYAEALAISQYYGYDSTLMRIFSFEFKNPNKNPRYGIKTIQLFISE